MKRKNIDEQVMRSIFKSWPAERQRIFLRGLISEHAYYSGLEGLPPSDELEGDANQRANRAEGERDAALNELQKLKTKNYPGVTNIEEARKEYQRLLRADDLDGDNEKLLLKLFPGCGKNNN